MHNESVRFATGPLQRMRGFLHRKRDWLGPGGVLVLAPCASVHTVGMRFALDIAFVDKEGCVLLALEDVPPGRFVKCDGAALVLERASNASTCDAFSCWFEEGDRIFVGKSRCL